MLTVKIIRVGRSLGILLPEDVLAQLHVGLGDALYMTECPDGYTLANYTRELDRQIQIAKKLMKRYENTLWELAR